MSALCVHPACVVSITLTMLRTESGRASNPRDVENIVVNISGRLIMIPRELKQRSDNDNNSVSIIIRDAAHLRLFNSAVVSRAKEHC